MSTTFYWPQDFRHNAYSTLPQPQSNHRVSFSIPVPPAPEVSNHLVHVVPAKEVDDDDSFGFNPDDDFSLLLQT